jgi:uncharacterized protein DUF6893
MRVVGLITSGVVGVIVLGAVAIGARSVPDIRRYLAIRRM